MKQHFIFWVISFPFIVIAQSTNNPKVIITHSSLSSVEPAYFLDSVLIDINTIYIDFDNIDSIKVLKDSFFIAGKIRFGKIFISSKNTNHDWTTLADIKEKNRAKINKQNIYIIDDKVIYDTTNVRIEVSAIKSMEISKSDKQKKIFREPAKTVFIITTKEWYKNRRKKNK